MSGGPSGRRQWPDRPCQAQLKRADRELKFLRTRLGRLIRDIRRKTEGDEALREAFALPLSEAMQIRRQRQNQRGRKPNSWHAPEAESIGKDKAHKPTGSASRSRLRPPIGAARAASSCSRQGTTWQSLGKSGFLNGQLLREVLPTSLFGVSELSREGPLPTITLGEGRDGAV